MKERSAIDATFERCRKLRRAAFIPYLMAGDPDLERGPDLLRALVDGGADLIEVGVPFSDPIADGPTNQRAAMRALESGTTLSGILRLIAHQREQLGVPIVLFSYFNPIHARGIERFAEQAASSGVDGLLLVDVPPEEAVGEILDVLAEYRIEPIFLLAPTSTKDRLKVVARHARGFVYYVSRTGVTGQREQLPENLAGEVRTVRKKIKRPVAVGFGISTPEQVAAVGEIADGVVVGSELVSVVEANGAAADLPRQVAERAAALSAPLRRRHG